MDYEFQSQEEDHSEALDEYKLWKKNTRFLYDTVITETLKWPSLTCQWFPDVEQRPDKNYKVQRLLLGTHTNDEESNYITFASVQLPCNTQDIDMRKYDEHTNEIGGYGVNNDAHIRIAQRIVHDGEVNRARYNFENPNIIATKARSGDVYIFDRTTYESSPKEDEPFNPALRLKGHDKEGYGLSWNPHIGRSSHVMSAGFDSRICLWDIGAASKKNRTIDALHTFRHHTGAIEDISWHQLHDSVFASVGDDKMLAIWDTRNNSNATPAYNKRAHDEEVNCVDFNPRNEWILATGSSDKTVALWDLRNLKVKIHALKGHEEEVYQVSWSPHQDSMLGTAGNDRRVILWDTKRIDENQEPETAGADPPEMLFKHGGHTGKILDLSWNPSEPWTIASTAEDNSVQVWQPNSHANDISIPLVHE